jgi:excisionase family DNA binding protein
MDAKSNPTVGNLQRNELLTVKEVADYLRVGRVTVWRWCKEGTIPACRVGRNWRIPRDDFLDLLNASYPSELDSAFAILPEDGDKNKLLPTCADDDAPLETTPIEVSSGNEEPQ